MSGRRWGEAFSSSTMSIVSNSQHWAMCERPALRTCSWPFSKPPRETLLRRDLTTKEQFDEHSIQRDARIFRRAESRASIDVGDPAFFLVGVAGVVGEPVDLSCA